MSDEGRKGGRSEGRKGGGAGRFGLGLGNGEWMRCVGGCKKGVCMQGKAEEAC